MARHRRRTASRRHAALLAAGLGASFLTLTAAAHAAAPRATDAAKCTIDFTTSNERPSVGENITLTWSSSGADQLVASWTTARVPLSGSQVTTKNSTGSASYQVTGLEGGQYCGGAAVNVVFVAASAPTTAAAPSTSSSSAAATSSAPTSSEASATAAPTSADPSFPAQSQTGGTGIPWFQQPVNLLVIGLLSLGGSLAMFNRRRVRAVLVRRH